MEDQFENQFLEFYSDNIELYGDSEEGIEEAYNDFVEEMGDMELESEIDAFSEFYSEMIDVYGDSEEGIEEAYNDFVELSEAQYSGNDIEDEFSDFEEGFIEYYNDMADVYGDSDEGLEEAYNDYVEAASEYDMEDEFSEEDLEEAFLEYYSELEDVYGDDVEEAYNDFMDVIEDEYASNAVKGGAAGALGGAALGAGVGYGLHKLAQHKDKKNVKKFDSKKKELKAKIAERKKAGKSTSALEFKLAALENDNNAAKTRLNNKKYTRNANMALLGGAGAVYGGIGGAALGTAKDNFSDEDIYGDFLNKAKEVATSKGAKVTGVGVLGAGAGLGAAHLATSKLRKRLKYLNAKGNRKTAAEEAEVKSLKKKILAAKVGGAVVVGGASAAVANKKFSDMEDVYSEEDFVNEFADFYADTEDIYGDNIEDAYNDFVEIMEDEYGDEGAKKPGFFSKAKGKISGGFNKAKSGVKGGFNKANGSNLGRAAMGAGVGTALGAATAYATDKNRKERIALAKKVKSGQATNAEKAKLAEMKKAKNKRLATGAGVGAVGGAVAGASSHTVQGAVAGFRSAEKGSKMKGIKNGARSGFNDAKSTKYFSDMNEGMDREFSFTPSASQAGDYIKSLVDNK